MDIRAVAFDANGTLVRILTEDGMEEIFRAAAHFLTYQGIDLCRDQVRELYFGIMAEQRHASPEEHPEFDAVGIWRRIITERQTAFTRALPAAKLEQMPLFMAEMYRGISRRRLGLYPHAREVLDTLRERYPLALVTDAQSAYARAELHRLIRRAAGAGACVVFASSDFHEVAEQCDRVLVMNGGALGCELRGAELSAERVAAESHRVRGRAA